MFTEPKQKRALFGLRPVTKDFAVGTKWPIEEIKVGRAAAEAESVAELATEVSEDRSVASRERGPSIDELISEDGTTFPPIFCSSQPVLTGANSAS